MNLRDQIENYNSFNNQEVKDRVLILKYIDMFDDVLTRNNEFVHFTSSGLVLNKKRDKVLMIYHNIFKSWTWPGGHADGDNDLLGCAIREVQEETGIKTIIPLSTEIFSIDILPVHGHIKHSKYVASHLHLSVAYLLEADDEELLYVKEDENSNVNWLPLDTFMDLITEEHMKKIYYKILSKAKRLNYVK